MPETLVTCPSCGHRFPVSNALSAELRTEIEAHVKADHEARLARAVEQARTVAKQALTVEIKDLKEQLAEKARRAENAMEQELALRKRTRELEEENKTMAERVRLEVEDKLCKEADQQLKTAIAETESRVRERSAQELKLLQQQLAEQQLKTREAEAAELELRKQKTALEERQRALDLEVARKVESEKQRLEEVIRKAVTDEQSLKLKEKEKQIEDLRKALEDAKRKSEQGSQELQGEVLELDIQTALEQHFPHDLIRPVPKGARGADLIQEVRNSELKPCGSIVWETKNTRPCTQ